MQAEVICRQSCNSLLFFTHLFLEPPLSTVGVDVGLWKYRKDLEPSNKKKGGKMKSVTFYTWDFGGQVQYTDLSIISSILLIHVQYMYM